MLLDHKLNGRSPKSFRLDLELEESVVLREGIAGARAVSHTWNHKLAAILKVCWYCGVLHGGDQMPVVCSTLIKSTL